MSKVNILNNQLSEIFYKTKDCSNIPHKGQSPHPTMPNINLTKNGIIKLLQTINVHKFTGPDAILARLLKEISIEITPAFTLLFRASLHQDKIPND